MKKSELKKLADHYYPLFCAAENEKSLKREMRKLGFSSKTSSGIAFINKRGGFVVKIACIVSEKNKSNIIITYSRKAPKRYDSWDRFMVQPLAKTDQKSKEKAMKILNEEHFDDEVDFHDENVGMYNGRAVLFDW